MDDVKLKELFKEKTQRYILGVINVVVGKFYGAEEKTRQRISQMSPEKKKIS